MEKMDIFNFKCKYCGGELNAVDGLKSVGKCKYCGSKQTLPKLENEKRANLFERANHLRRNNEFDKAEALYEQLLNEDLSDPEAYWSLVLCRYGIEYVEDKRSGERLPTVNRMQMVSILADEDYKSAIANADDEQRALYEEEAKLINEIQKGILEIARKEEPFDIFICYKETDADGKRSRDSILAQDLYHELTRDGYKVFFARVTLQGKLGSAYEPYIFSALNSAKVMVVLGTRKEHFEAVWVRNEWSRFLGQIKKGERKVLIPAYRDMDAYDLPVEFSNLQALDMSRLGFLQELVEGVENILKSYKKKEAPKAEPAPKHAPAPEPPKKKKKSKAPIIVVAILLALAIAGVAVFASGVLDPFLGGSQTEETTDSKTEKPTEKTTAKPTESETDGLTKEPSDLSYVSVHETMYVNNIEEGYFFLVDGLQHYLEHGVEVIRTGVSFDGEWSKIEYDGMKGYVPSEYLSYDKLFTETESIENTESDESADTDEPTGDAVTEPTEAPTDKVVIVGVPDTYEYTKVSETMYTNNEGYIFEVDGVQSFMDHGAEVLRIGVSTDEKGTWSKVEYKGQTGYIRSEYLSYEIEDQLTEEGLAYRVSEDGLVYISGIGNYTDDKLLIPAEINGKKVYGIADRAFHGIRELKSVVISDGIEKIGKNAFAECTLIESLLIGNSVSEIGEYAFDQLVSISTLEIPDSVVSVGAYAFRNCCRAKTVRIGEGVVTIGDHAFEQCNSFTELVIPDSVESIGESAFYDCTLLHSVTLGRGLKTVGTSAFDGVADVKKVNYRGSAADWEKIDIGENNVYLTDEGIEHNYDYTGETGETEAPTEKPTEAPTEKPTEEPTEAPAPEITVENPVTVIEEGKAYLGVLAHKNIDNFLYLNGTIDGYYLGAVDNEAAAANVYFERSTDGNYYMYFLGDDADVYVYVNLFVNGSYINYSLDPTPDTVWHYNQDYKCLVANLGGELIFLGTSNTGTYGNFVPKRVSEIDGYFTMQLIVSPVQPEQKPVGEPSLEFELDGATDSYRVVGLGSVTGENVVIPSTYNGKPVKFIGAHAFEKCIDMKTLTVPKSIVHIDDYAFNNCINLFYITYEGSYEEWMEINTSIWGNDSLRNEGMKMDYGQIAADPEPENYDFSFVWAPDGESFYVAGLWEYSDPTRVVIPETHKGLFVTGINDYAFQAQDVITSLYIPATVTYIGENAFAECPNLSKVEFEGTAATWEGIHIGNGNEMLIKAEIIYEVILGECQHKNLGMEACTVYCTDCGATIDTVHQSTELLESVDPTESQGGYIKYKCHECGETWTETFPPSGNGDSGSDSEKTVMSAEELKALITQINNGDVSNDITIIIGNDIDFDGLYFEPIHEFRGTIDGNGKKISNIELTHDGMNGNVTDGPGSTYEALCIGFICTAYDVTVRNLTLDSVTANLETDQNVYIGALAGYADGLVIEDCTVNSNITVNESAYSNTTGVAGVIGYSLDALIQRTKVDATVTHTAQSGESHTGAILGAGNVRVHDCTIDLAVTFIGQGGAGHAGWLIGREYTDASVDCATLQGSIVKGTFQASNCMYTWDEVGQGYLYIRHGEQIDPEAYNKLIYVTSPEDYVEPELPEDPGDSEGEVVSVTVSDASGLVYVIDQINSGAYANNVTIELSDNIDMSGVTFTPIKDFRGVFDGKGYSISNLVLTETGTSVTVKDGNLASYSATAVGLIASATGATVRGLTLDYVTAEINTSSKIVIGALIGWAKNVNVADCEIRSDLNVTVGTNDISGVSGLIGYVETGAMIERVTVNSTITCTLGSGESFTGSVVAFSVGIVDIVDCVIDLNVASTSKGGNGHVGALAGMLKDSYGCSYLYNTVVNGTIESNSEYFEKLVGEGYFCDRDYNSPKDEAGLAEYGNVFSIEMITNK